VAPTTLREVLQSTPLSLDDVRDFLLVDCKTYTRNVVERNADFEVMVFCWLPGQRSRIHDHPHSACGVRIINGVATETVFTRVEGSELVRRGESSALHRGEVTASFDADIHRVENIDEQSEMLVTLHVYSPPLALMNTYQAEPVPEEVGVK